MSFRYERRHLSDDLILWETFGSPTPEQWAELLAGVAQWLTEAERRGRRLRLVLDPSAMTTISATTRRLFGQWRAENLALIANSVACAAYVADGTLVRAVLHASFWFAPPVVPVQVFGSRAAALHWLDSQVHVPMSLSLPSF